MTKFIFYILIVTLSLPGCTTSLKIENNEYECTDESVILSILDNKINPLLYCLENGYPVSGYGNSGIGNIINEPAYWAISENWIEIIKILIGHGLDVNYEWGKSHGSIMIVAVQFGTKEMVELL